MSDTLGGLLTIALLVALLAAVYVPYGDRSRWYRYAMHRMAERPADTRFLFRSGTTKG